MEKSLKRMDKKVLDLSSSLKGMSQKNEGIDSTLRILENKQESTERVMRDLIGKYEHLVAYMAQMNKSLLNLSKEKGVNESCKSPIMGRVSVGSKGGETSKANRNNSKGRREVKIPKIDFPTFKGENPREWIKKVERFFQLLVVDENQMVAVAEM
ncbi:hypothetical protein ACH5RR_018933 [Cinchona calisaya]|uniref:Gag-pol polyprotein n=1 Tax=Cinchona calisaya TaxID=153742 RepID=A0ABD2ZMV8_9GENT